MSINATLKWNEKTKIMLQEAPEKVVREIARKTLDYTGTQRFVADSTNATYKLPPGYTTGKTIQTMHEKAVQGNYETGFYIGNFTDYAMYVYPKQSGSHWHWTNPNTKTRWFEYTWEKHGSGFIEQAIKEYKK